jgi:hypothetical protein
MKKLLSLSLLIVTIAFSAQAQKGLHLGIKAIPQSTWMFNNADSDNPEFIYKSTFRSAFGLDADYHFTDGVGAGINLLFSAQGQKFEDRDGFFQGFRKLTYLKLPILLNFNTSSESVVMFKGSIGPQFSFPLRATLETNSVGFFGSNVSSETDIKDYYKVDIGVVFGFGLGFNITEYLQASLGLRFDGGFTSDDLDAMDSLEGATLGYTGYPVGEDRPSTIQVTGGVEIGFKYILRMD